MATSRRKDMIGKRFGTLTVLEISAQDKYYNILYRCVCDCGKERLSLGGKISRRGKAIKKKEGSVI